MVKRYYAVVGTTRAGVCRTRLEAQHKIAGTGRGRFKEFKTYTEASDYIKRVKETEDNQAAARHRKLLTVKKRHDKVADKVKAQNKVIEEANAKNYADLPRRKKNFNEMWKRIGKENQQKAKK